MDELDKSHSVLRVWKRLFAFVCLFGEPSRKGVKGRNAAQVGHGQGDSLLRRFRCCCKGRDKPDITCDTCDHTVPIAAISIKPAQRLFSPRLRRDFACRLRRLQDGSIFKERCRKRKYQCFRSRFALRRTNVEYMLSICLSMIIYVDGMLLASKKSALICVISGKKRSRVSVAYGLLPAAGPGAVGGL